MNKTIILFLLFFVISLFFINCSEDEVTNPRLENDHSPSVSISNPADCSSFVVGDTVYFSGIGEDYEGNALPDSLLLWVFNHNDTVATGTSLSTDTLSKGIHAVSFIGFDNNGRTDSDSILIHIDSSSIPTIYGLITVPSTSGYPMGWEGISNDEEPIHMVSLDEYQIAKFEVTYSLWEEVKSWAESNGYTFENTNKQASQVKTDTDQHPITMISWFDCIAWCNAYSEKEGFDPVYYTNSSQTTVYRNVITDGDIGNDCVNWLADGFRLPTEAEWEYASRYSESGNDLSPGSKHSGFNIYPSIDNCAWYSVNAGGGTHPVGNLFSNSLCLYDISGNVWEWCWDWYDKDYYSASPLDNPYGPDNGNYRVFRGGGWYWDESACRTTNRNGDYPSTRNVSLGFRVCRNAIP